MPKSARNKGVTSNKLEGNSELNKPSKVSNDVSDGTANVQRNDKQSNKPAKSDNQLSQVIEQWPNLPKEIRSAIVGIVRASIDKEGGR